MTLRAAIVPCLALSAAFVLAGCPANNASTCKPACSAGQLCVGGTCVVASDAGQPGAADAGARDAGAPDAGATCNPDCTADQLCVRGLCYPKICDDTACRPGEICIQATCIPEPCAGVQCSGGTVCQDGTCVSPLCGGVACEAGQGCKASKCVDALCVPVDCPGTQVCAGGLCFDPNCSAFHCRAGEVCFEGHCIDARCIGANCPAGKRCEQGFCTACATLETNCGDGIDDDCDGLTDCADPDCDTVPCTPASTCSTAGACASLKCQPPVPAAAGKSCRPASGPCDVAESCDGVNADCPTDRFAAANAPCPDDGNPCTADACDGLGACAHPNVTDGTPCGTGNICVGGACQAGCFIGTAAYPSGGQNSANWCQKCEPTASTTSWTNAAVNDPCAPDTNECTRDLCDASGNCLHPSAGDGTACTGGFCSAGTCHTDVCVIAGLVYSSGQKNPAGACEACTPSTSRTAWSDLGPGTACTTDNNECTTDACDGAGTCVHTPVTDNTPCGGGALQCKSGQCGTSCVIASQTFTPGTLNPANPCQLCDPARSATAWSSAASGATCPADANSCTADACDGAGACAHPALPEGTSCGSAQFCTGGACTTGCFIAGAFVAANAVDPASGGCQHCSTTAPDRWTALSQGTACTDEGNLCTSDTCNNSGACAHSALADGAPCGTGQVCSASSCKAGCFIGAAFKAPSTVNPANVCQGCVPASSTTAWSMLPDGAACLGNGFACVGGFCLEPSCTPGAWRYETVDANGTVGDFTSMAADSLGGLHVAYFDDSNNHLKYAYHGPRGYWAISVLDATADRGSYTAAAYDSSGGVHLAYYDATNTNLNYAYRPAGGNWAFAIIDQPNSVGTYPSLAVDGANNVHVVFYDSTGGNLRYAYKPSGGAWQTAVAIDGVAPAVNVGQYASIAATSAGDVHVAYYDLTNQDLKYAYKPAGGAWQLFPAVDSTNNVGQYTSIALDSTGTVHIAYYDATNANLKHAFKPAAGAWQLPVLIDGTGVAVGEYASLAIDPSDNLHVTYYDATNNHLKYATRPAGGAWQAPAIVDQLGTNEGLYTSLAADRTGGLHVAYQDAGNNDLKYAYKPAGGAWLTTIVDAPNTQGQRPSILVDPAGGVRIAYYDGSAHVLKYAFRPPGGLWASQTIDATADVTGQYPAIAVDPSGNVHVVSYDSTATALRYVTKPAGGAWSAPVAVDNLADCGQFASIAADKNGGVHVAYYDTTTNDLKYAYKPAGGAWQTFPAIDTVGDVGQYTSIGVDAALTVHLAYYDVTNKNLKYAFKPSGGSWTLAAVQSTGDVGQHTSLSVDPGGKVHITYWDYAAALQQLKHVVRDTGGLWSQPYVVDAVNQSGEYSSIITNGGTPRVSYYRNTYNGTTYVPELRFGVFNGTSWTTETADPANDTGTFNSIALDVDGLVHVVYYGTGNADLRHAYKCP